MDNMEPRNGRNVSWWITSLATSVTCCAVLFVIFANYFVEINKNLADENMRLTAMEVHENKVLVEVEALHRALVPSAVPAATTAAAPAPTATTPGASVTPPAASPQVPADVMAPASTPPATPAK